MDDVTNTLDAAATAAQPSVRVRVVDATTRKTMNEYFTTVTATSISRRHRHAADKRGGVAHRGLSL